MALTECKECREQVSTEAATCPHCGCPGPAVRASSSGGGDAGLSSAGSSCPYCQEPLRGGAATTVCANCGAPHHAECWQENEGCSTFGCRTASLGSHDAGQVPASRAAGVALTPELQAVRDRIAAVDAESGRPSSAVRRPRRLWFWVLAITATWFGVCSARVLAYPRPSRDLAYSFGYWLGSCGPFFVTLWGAVAIGRRTVTRRVGLVVVGLGLVTVGSSFGYVTMNRAREHTEREAARTTARHIANVERALAEGRPVPARTETVPDDDGETMLRFVEDIARDTSEMSARFEERLSALHPETLLTAEAYSSAAALDDASARVAEALRAVDDQEREGLAYLGALESRMRALDVSESARSSMVKGFHSTNERSAQAFRRLCRQERDMFSAMAATYSFVRRHQGRYEVREGQVLFESDASAKEFNRLVDRATSRAAEVVSTVATYRDTMQRNAQDLERKVR